MSALSFVPTTLDVIRLRAAQAPSDAEPHIKWSLQFDTAPESAVGAFVVIGELHAGGPGGWADITVGSFFKHSPDLDLDDLPDLITDSEAQESVYDFARSHLIPLLALVSADVEIPGKSPVPEVTTWGDEDDDDDDVKKTALEG